MISMQRYTSLKGNGLYFLLFLWSLWFINFTGRTIFSPLLPFIEDEFAVTHARASSIYMFISGGYSLSLFFSGIVGALLGPRKAILASLATSSAVFFIIPFVKVFWLLYICTFFFGMGSGLYITSAIPLITEYYEERIWGRTIAIHDSATSLSFFGAPFIALAVLSLFPWRGIFVLFALALTICAIIFPLVSEEVHMEEGRRYFDGTLLLKRQLWYLSIVWVFATGANFGIYLILPLYLTKELSMDVSHGNTILGLSRLGGIMVAISAGFFVDRFSLKKAMLFLLLTTGGLTMLLGIRETSWIKWIMFFQATLSIGFFPISLVAISRLFEREARGQAIGFILTLASVIGIGLIPYLLGVSGDLASFRLGILILGILTSASSGFLFFLKELK